MPNMRRVTIQVDVFDNIDDIHFADNVDSAAWLLNAACNGMVDCKVYVDSCKHFNPNFCSSCRDCDLTN